MKRLQAVTALVRGPGRFATIARILVLRVLAVGVNMCTGLLTAAMLGPAGRGEQAAMTVAPSFFAALGVVGLHASFIYNARAEPEHEREWLGATLLLTTITGLIVAGAGWIIMPYWLHDYDAGVVWYARLFLITTPFTVVTYGFIAAAELRGWFGFANSTLYVQSFGILILLALMSGLHVLTPVTSAFAYMAPTVPAFFYFGWNICRRVKPRFNLRRQFAERLFRYGIRFYGIDILGTATQYLDQIMIVALLPAGSVGIYAVALSLARMLNIVQVAISSVLFPSIAAKEKAVVVEAVAATVRVASVVTAVIALAVGLVGPLMIGLLYGARFADAVAPFRMLLVDAVFASTARIVYQAYSGSGRPEWVTGFELAGVIVSFCGMTLLIPQFGLPGAALAMACGSVVRLACGVLGLRIILKAGVPRLLLSPADIRDVLRYKAIKANVLPEEAN